MNTKQVIVVRKDLNMRKGKIAAQAAHAAMMFMIQKGELLRGLMVYGAPTSPSFITTKSKDSGCGTVTLSAEEVAWLTDPESAFAKVVLTAESEQELRNVMLACREAGLVVNEVIDAGRTEFNGVATLTCAAIGPHKVEKFTGLTDHLKLM